MCAAGSSLRLKQRVAGQKPEADRRVELCARAGESARRLAGDEIEMRRLATNDGADGNESVVPFGDEQPPADGG